MIQRPCDCNYGTLKGGVKPTVASMYARRPHESAAVPQSRSEAMRKARETKRRVWSTGTVWRVAMVGEDPPISGVL